LKQQKRFSGVCHLLFSLRKARQRFVKNGYIIGVEKFLRAVGQLFTVLLFHFIAAQFTINSDGIDFVLPLGYSLVGTQNQPNSVGSVSAHSWIG